MEGSHYCCPSSYVCAHEISCCVAVILSAPGKLMMRSQTKSRSGPRRKSFFGPEIDLQQSANLPVRMFTFFPKLSRFDYSHTWPASIQFECIELSYSRRRRVPKNQPATAPRAIPTPAAATTAVNGCTLIW